MAQVATAGFVAVAEKLRGNGAVSLLAVDEAHCISSWGHDVSAQQQSLSAATGKGYNKIIDGTAEPICV